MRSRIPARLLFFPLLVLALSLAGSTGPASAATVTDRPTIGAFDGSGSTAGRFLRPFRLAVDNSTGFVYVSEDTGGRNVVSRFDRDGNPAPFSSIGSSSLTGSPGKPFAAAQLVAVDNSGSATQGRLYVVDFGNAAVKAFTPSGEFLCEIDNNGLGFQAADVAVDKLGQAWAIAASGGESARFPVGSCLTNQATLSVPPPSPDEVIDFDFASNMYLRQEGKVNKYPPPQFAVAPIVLDPGPAEDAYADQSSAAGHVFTLHKEDFNEYDSSGALVGTFGKGGGVDLGRGIAASSYDPPGPESPDRVYVADEGLREVDILGSVATGGVPDPTVEATDPVGIGKATFHGTINPQGVANGYYFEWTASSTTWGDVERSPEQSLPVDSSPHPVTYTTTSLAGNSNYRVRLVAINRVSGATDGLRKASGIDQFTTNQASEAPLVSAPKVEAEPVSPCPSGIEAHSACVTSSIDPQEDQVRWRVQLSDDDKCKEGSFKDQPQQILFGGGTSSPVLVSDLLEGLRPAQHYCVRIFAQNSFGSVTSATTEFTTLAIKATEAGAAFAAPRLDTSARLNARVNPQGASFQYRFEYSKDDGTTWNELPILENSSGAREQIVIAEELGGLDPATTYRYRLGLVKNKAGETESLGQELTFTTRSTAAVRPPSPCPNEAARLAQHTDGYLAQCRGIELVNSPDKGNQHARAEVLLGTPPLSPDGERAMWNVLAGAPEGNTGSGATFLAKRGADGWESKGVLGAPSEQPEEGEAGGYTLQVATRELSYFLFNAGVTAVTFGNTLVGADTQKTQTLATYSAELFGGGADLSKDGSHAFYIDKGGTHQLKDIGAAGGGEVVSIMPDGLAANCGLDSSELNHSFVGGGSGDAAAKQWRPGSHMVSGDGSRIYFEAKLSEKCGSSLYGLYQRNRTAGPIVKGKAAGETTLIDPGAGGNAPQFIWTSPDGREALYLTFGKCRRYEASEYPLNVACEEEEAEDENSDPDVYRWSEEEGKASCLTCVVEDADLPLEGSSAVAKGKVLVSGDGSQVYFESEHQLVEGEGRAGDLNLYVLGDGQIRFVADPHHNTGVLGNEAQLSSDGKTLVFRAPASAALTADEVPGNTDQLYLYDDREESLECVSCRHDGPTEAKVGTSAGSITDRIFKLSGDGSTVAFATPSALLEGDVNHGVDIYAWKDGARGLISDGISSFPQGEVAAPQVQAVGDSGRDVLFSLVDPGLTGFEQDGLANFYDARIGGGFIPPSPQPHCSEESCQGPLAPPPPISPDASSGYVGPGNPEPGGKGRCRRSATKAKAKTKKGCRRQHKKAGHRRAHKQKGGPAR
jgi:hypothetical protein